MPDTSDQQDVPQGRQMTIVLVSSSSHLVTAITLHGYFEKYEVITWIRVGAVAVYATLTDGFIVSGRPGRFCPLPLAIVTPLHLDALRLPIWIWCHRRFSKYEIWSFLPRYIGNRVKLFGVSLAPRLTLTTLAVAEGHTLLADLDS